MLKKLYYDARTYVYKVRVARHILAAAVLEWQASCFEARIPTSAGDDDEFYRYGEAMLRLRSQRHADRAARLLQRHLDGDV